MLLLVADAPPPSSEEAANLFRGWGSRSSRDRSACRRTWDTKSGATVRSSTTGRRATRSRLAWWRRRSTGPGSCAARFVRTIARLPEGTDRDGVRFAQPPAIVAAVELGRGRVVVVADDSVFANEMLLELDNVRFARNTIKWLVRDRSVAMLSVLFLGDVPEGAGLIDRRFEAGSGGRRCRPYSSG